MKSKKLSIPRLSSTYPLTFHLSPLLSVCVASVKLRFLFFFKNRIYDKTNRLTFTTVSKVKYKKWVKKERLELRKAQRSPSSLLQMAAIPATGQRLATQSPHFGQGSNSSLQCIPLPALKVAEDLFNLQKEELTQKLNFTPKERTTLFLTNRAEAPIEAEFFKLRVRVRVKLWRNSLQFGMTRFIRSVRLMLASLLDILVLKDPRNV